MALLQMPEFNEENSYYKDLNDKIALLEEKLKNKDTQLAVVCNERDTVAQKVQEAIKLVEQRDRSIKRIETQVRELHGLAIILQKENADFKAANEQLTQSLNAKQNDLEAMQQNFENSASHSDVMEKIDALEASLSTMLEEIKAEEKSGFDSVSKKISIISDAGFQMKVLSTLNSVDQNTSRLRNYNDAKCLSEIENLGKKIDRVDNRITDYKFVGVLCALCVGVGVMLAKILI